MAREKRTLMALANMVFLTGAGISAESGLGTFRDKGGIWTKYPLEDLATPEGFARDPAFVHGFYNDRRAQLETAQPNSAHTALVKLEKAVVRAGFAFTLVTQNVDNLHEQAGSSAANLIHMHGELAKARCTHCGHVMAWRGALGGENVCPKCMIGAGMRPHVVWFGEMPLQMDKIEAALAACDVFVSIGTSGDVYPASGFVEMARYFGAKTVELNLEPSANASAFVEADYGTATKVVPAWVEAVLA